MNADGYHPEKKAMPIIGLIIMIIALLGFLAYTIALYGMKILSFSEPITWAILLSIFVIAATAAGLIAVAKKKKYGSQKLIRTSEVISYAAFIILILQIFLRIFIK